MQIRMMSLLLSAALASLWASGAAAQPTVLNTNVPAAFAMTGLLQAATLNPGGAPSAGGTLTVNNITIIVPDNSVIQMPAHALTWAGLFDPAQSGPVFDGALPPPATPPVNHPANNSIGQPMTGLALSDTPANPPAGAFTGFFPSCEVTVVGNIDASGASGRPPGSYIAALILPISQEIANGGIGFITEIDYAKGRFEVNGTLNTLGTGTVVEVNDPVGRFGLAHSPDPRFTADTDNPTVASGNGYPMGIPTVAPPAIDPDRPLFNRPLNPAPGVAAPFRHDPLLQVGAPLTSFAMPAAAAPNATGVTTPDPWKQVPFMVGDFVAFSGNLYKINPNAPVTPFNPAAPAGPDNRPMSQQFYISATTVTAEKVEVVTAPGTVANGQGPAYMTLFRGRIGTGGNSLTVPANTALGIDDGGIPIVEPRRDISVRGWVTDASQLVDVDPTSGAEAGRLLGSILPEAGFAAGRYQAPTFEFLIADAPPGFPVSPSNFKDFPFLLSGEGTRTISGTALTVGPLLPFPPSTP